MRKGETQRLGLSAEDHVLNLLRYHGRKVSKQKYLERFDLLVDGYRCEVKCAKPHKDGEYGIDWLFNIHRHGLIKEDAVDFYILRLEDVPYSKAAIHMVFKAPLGIATTLISVRSLLNQHYAKAVSDFYALANGLLGQRVEAA